MEEEVIFSEQQLNDKTITELYEIAKELGISGFRKLKKNELISSIIEYSNNSSIEPPKENYQYRENNQLPTTQVTITQQPYNQMNYYNNLGTFPLIYAQGILEVLPEGYGFIRVKSYLPSSEDIYVSQTQIKKFKLKTGHILTGQIRPPKDGEKYHSLLKLEMINGHHPELLTYSKDFDDLTPVYPNEMIRLENSLNPENISARMIDLFSPIGKGQRGLIVSPPKAGKTTLLKAIANSISLNNPEIYLMALLIDERPEEVTDFRRSIKGEVVASTFDEIPDNHIRITELTLEKAKRLVEHGYDVVILLDSITRMSRAYNLVIPPSGRTLSGGLDPYAMHRPKRFFGAARNIENGGSLTILATSLVETGSRMDDVIFEEFKGTGNMELRLDRKLSERRIFPAMDIKQSGTRKEELLLTKEELRKQLILRRTLDSGETFEIAEFLIDRLKKSKTNSEFLASIVDTNN
ncbi:MAG: transcription termination factor Rho [Candidatus Sericytochromatia bacterium]|nr:MAG: transcription termination factor Rho [Candidatus Sericytochromatia bacterium]